MTNKCRMDKCIMPEQQYCPCCPNGYISYKDEDYEGYEIPTECEWGCTLGCLDER
jgi:hypothetical protein